MTSPAPATGEPLPNPLPNASLGRRLAALVYEGLLLTALLFAVNFALLPLVAPGHAGQGKDLVVPALPQRLALFWITFAVLAAYFCWCWSHGRRTLAMKTWRLRLVRADGGPPHVSVLSGDGHRNAMASGGPLPPRTALLRYLAAWIGPLLAVLAYAVLAPHGAGAHATWLVALGFLWAFVDRDRQFLHDRIAGTRIVRE